MELEQAATAERAQLGQATARERRPARSASNDGVKHDMEVRLKMRLCGVLLASCLGASCERPSGSPPSLSLPRSPTADAEATYGVELPPDRESWVIQEYPTLNGDKLMDSSSVLVLNGTDVTPIAVKTGENIYTWQELEVRRELRSTAAPDCRPASVPQEIRPGLRNGRKRVAIRMQGGSVVVGDESHRTVQSGPAGSMRFQSGTRYLVFGEMCAGVLEMTFGPQSVFGVQQDEVITTFAWLPPEPESRQAILALRTIERLAEALHERRERGGHMK